MGRLVRPISLVVEAWAGKIISRAGKGGEARATFSRELHNKKGAVLKGEYFFMPLLPILNIPLVYKTYTYIVEH